MRGCMGLGCRGLGESEWWGVGDLEVVKNASSKNRLQLEIALAWYLLRKWLTKGKNFRRYQKAQVSGLESRVSSDVWKIPSRDQREQLSQVSKRITRCNLRIQTKILRNVIGVEHCTCKSSVVVIKKFFCLNSISKRSQRKFKWMFYFKVKSPSNFKKKWR